LKLLQKDVAKIIGVDKTTIYNWENNRNSPEIRFIPKIISFLEYVPYDVSKLTFGQRIKIARQSLGMNGRELAKVLGIDPSTLFSWQKGEHMPSKRLWEKLEEFFKTYSF